MRGGFPFLQGGLEIQISQKFLYLIVFYISIWGGLELYLGEISPPKPHRGDGTAPRSTQGKTSPTFLERRTNLGFTNKSPSQQFQFKIQSKSDKLTVSKSKSCLNPKLYQSCSAKGDIVCFVIVSHIGNITFCFMFHCMNFVDCVFWI